MIPPDPILAPRRSVAVLGLGASGRAAATLAQAHGCTVVGFDEGTPPELPFPCHAGEEAVPAADRLASGIDLAILSPGVPPESAVLRILREARVPVISEIEFAFRHCEVPVLAITGTNGKTTTTGLAAHLLDSCGWRTTPCGNYGTPFSEVVMPGSNQRIATVEVSSFQLEEITSFRPDVAVWLNFAPDHLDRYADLEEYLAAKRRIFDFQRPEDVAVVREGENLGLDRRRIRTFTAEANSTADLQLAPDGDGILYQGEEIARLSETRLRGLHNAENLMAAMVAVHLASGIPFAEMREPLASFEPPRHRCEFVRSLDGIDFINDSKATNIHALESSLKAFPQPVVLLIGGKDKGLDYSTLPPLLRERARHVVVLGEIADSLAELLSTSGFEYFTIVDSLPLAVEVAHAAAHPGDVVLLSPGTSSFDMFGSYQERGDVFCQVVRELSPSTTHSPHPPPPQEPSA